MLNLPQNTNLKMIFPIMLASALTANDANITKIEFSQDNTNKILNIGSLMHINYIDDKLFRSMLNFAENIIKNSHDLDADFAKIINDNIVDLLA